MSVALEAPPKVPSVRKRLLELITTEGSLISDAEKNDTFFLTILPRLGTPTPKPGTIGTELVAMERVGLVFIERANGPMTAMRTVRLTTDKEKDAARKRNERATKRTQPPKNKNTSVLPVLADPGVHTVEIVDQAALDHAEAAYFKRLLLKVADVDIHTFIQAAKAVG